MDKKKYFIYYLRSKIISYYFRKHYIYIIKIYME